MARTEYTTRRRLMMQIVVWVVCAAAVALAAGVAQWKAARMRVELAPAQTIGGLEIRLPQGWMTEVGSQSDIHLISSAEQVQGGGFRRALIVRRQSVKSEPDPLEFLMANVLNEDGAADVDAGPAEWISVDGHKGVVLECPYRTLVGRTIHTEQQTVACVTLDGGDVVVIQYIGRGDPYGKDMVRQIAQSLRAADDGAESAPRRKRLPAGGAV